VLSLVDKPQFCLSVRKFIAREKGWLGTPSDLLEELRKIDSTLQIDNVFQLSALLRHNKELLDKYEIRFKRMRIGSGGVRYIMLWYEDNMLYAMNKRWGLMRDRGRPRKNRCNVNEAVGQDAGSTTN